MMHREQAMPKKDSILQEKNEDGNDFDLDDEMDTYLTQLEEIQIELLEDTGGEASDGTKSSPKPFITDNGTVSLIAKTVFSILEKSKEEDKYADNKEMKDVANTQLDVFQHKIRKEKSLLDKIIPKHKHTNDPENSSYSEKETKKHKEEKNHCDKLVQNVKDDNENSTIKISANADKDGKIPPKLLGVVTSRRDSDDSTSSGISGMETVILPPRNPRQPWPSVAKEASPVPDLKEVRPLSPFPIAKQDSKSDMHKPPVIENISSVVPRREIEERTEKTENVPMNKEEGVMPDSTNKCEEISPNRNIVHYGSLSPPSLNRLPRTRSPERKQWRRMSRSRTPPSRRRKSRSISPWSKKWPHRKKSSFQSYRRPKSPYSREKRMKSPYSRRSHSPRKKRWSPHVRRSHSPSRKKSWSPHARRSQSPRSKKSWSPQSRRSQSPVRLHSSSLRSYASSLQPRRLCSPPAKGPGSPSLKITITSVKPTCPQSPSRFHSPYARRRSGSQSPRRLQSPYLTRSHSPVARPHTPSVIKPHSSSIMTGTPISKLRSLIIIPQLSKKRSASPPIRLQSSSVRRSHSQSPRSNSQSSKRSCSQSKRRSHSQSPRRSHSQSSNKSCSQSPRRSPSQSLKRCSLSPISSHSLSPRKSRSRSPRKSRSQSPRKSRSQSPRKSRSRSPRKSRSQSPRKSHLRPSRETYSPRRLRSQYSRRSKSRSPRRLRPQSPRRLRPQSPRRLCSRSPRRLRSRSPRRSRSRSPRRLRSRSPKRLRSRSPRKSRSRSPRKSYSSASRGPYSPYSKKERTKLRSPCSPYRRSGSSMSLSLSPSPEPAVMSKIDTPLITTCITASDFPTTNQSSSQHYYNPLPSSSLTYQYDYSNYNYYQGYQNQYYQGNFAIPGTTYQNYGNYNYQQPFYMTSQASTSSSVQYSENSSATYFQPPLPPDDPSCVPPPPPPSSPPPPEEPPSLPSQKIKTLEHTVRPDVSPLMSRLQSNLRYLLPEVTKNKPSSEIMKVINRALQSPQKSSERPSSPSVPSLPISPEVGQKTPDKETHISKPVGRVVPSRNLMEENQQPKNLIEGNQPKNLKNEKPQLRHPKFKPIVLNLKSSPALKRSAFYDSDESDIEMVSPLKQRKTNNDPGKTGTYLKSDAPETFNSSTELENRTSITKNAVMLNTENKNADKIMVNDTMKVQNTDIGSEVNYREQKLHIYEDISTQVIAIGKVNFEIETEVEYNRKIIKANELEHKNKEPTLNKTVVQGTDIEDENKLKESVSEAGEVLKSGSEVVSETYDCLNINETSVSLEAKLERNLNNNKECQEKNSEIGNVSDCLDRTANKPSNGRSEEPEGGMNNIILKTDTEAENKDCITNKMKYVHNTKPESSEGIEILNVDLHYKKTIDIADSIGNIIQETSNADKSSYSVTKHRSESKKEDSNMDIQFENKRIDIVKTITQKTNYIGDIDKCSEAKRKVASDNKGENLKMDTEFDKTVIDIAETSVLSPSNVKSMGCSESIAEQENYNKIINSIDTVMHYESNVNEVEKARIGREPNESLSRDAKSLEEEDLNIITENNKEKNKHAERKVNMEEVDQLGSKTCDSVLQECNTRTTATASSRKSEEKEIIKMSGPKTKKKIDIEKETKQQSSEKDQVSESSKCENKVKECSGLQIRAESDDKREVLKLDTVLKNKLIDNIDTGTHETSNANLIEKTEMEKEPRDKNREVDQLGTKACESVLQECNTSSIATTSYKKSEKKEVIKMSGPKTRRKAEIEKETKQQSSEKDQVSESSKCESKVKECSGLEIRAERDNEREVLKLKNPLIDNVFTVKHETINENLVEKTEIEKESRYRNREVDQLGTKACESVLQECNTSTTATTSYKKSEKKDVIKMSGPKTRRKAEIEKDQISESSKCESKVKECSRLEIRAESDNKREVLKLKNKLIDSIDTVTYETSSENLVEKTEIEKEPRDKNREVDQLGANVCDNVLQECDMTTTATTSYKKSEKEVIKMTGPKTRRKADIEKEMKQQPSEKDNFNESSKCKSKVKECSGLEIKAESDNKRKVLKLDTVLKNKLIDTIDIVTHEASNENIVEKTEIENEPRTRKQSLSTDAKRVEGYYRRMNKTENRTKREIEPESEVNVEEDIQLEAKTFDNVLLENNKLLANMPPKMLTKSDENESKTTPGPRSRKKTDMIKKVTMQQPVERDHDIERLKLESSSRKYATKDRKLNMAPRIVLTRVEPQSSQQMHTPPSDELKSDSENLQNDLKAMLQITQILSVKQRTISTQVDNVNGKLKGKVKAGPICSAASTHGSLLSAVQRVIKKLSEN